MYVYMYIYIYMYTHMCIRTHTASCTHDILYIYIYVERERGERERERFICSFIYVYHALAHALPTRGAAAWPAAAAGGRIASPNGISFSIRVRVSVSISASISISIIIIAIINDCIVVGINCRSERLRKPACKCTQDGASFASEVFARRPRARRLNRASKTWLACAVEPESHR